MKIDKINVEISNLSNKNNYYLYERMFSFAKEHKIQGEFGRDYITLRNMPESLLKFLEQWKIKFKRFKAGA